MEDKNPKISSSGNPVTKPTPSSNGGETSDQKKDSGAADFEQNENPEETTEENEEQEEALNEAEQEEPSPRFDEVDIMFYMFLAIAGDIGDGVWVTRLFFAPTTLLFLYLKGVDSAISRNAIAQFVELVPVLGWLPISTTAAVFTIFATNHPEKFQKWFGKAGEAIEKAGKIGKGK